MTYVPSHIDFTLALTMVGLMAVEVCIFARLRRAPAREARLPAYTYLIAYQWVLVAFVLALWIARKRPWSLLLMASPNRWGFGISLALAGALVILLLLQRRTLRHRPELGEKAHGQIAQVEWLVPHTPRERRLWTVAAMTAGCCEEVLFRGFLLVFVASLAGLFMAVLTNVLLFGLFHAYYGWRGILKTASFGLVMALMALWSASLIPVIIIHATVDLNTGDLAYRLLTKSSPPTAI
ncbi:MAG TPA: type II CAAX endopeptidase family protein [Terriglobales bacterium]|nr:type II CAAX endopeptidase family protein [Terriglobales bacterium]